MGRSLIACAQGDPELEIVAEIDQGDDLAKVISRADAIIDFSVREATVAVAKLAADHKKALVIGTTAMAMRKEDRTRCNEDDSRGLVGKLQHGREHIVLDDTKGGGDCWQRMGSRGRRNPSHRQEDAPSGTAKRLQEILNTCAARMRLPMRCASATSSAIIRSASARRGTP